MLVQLKARFIELVIEEKLKVKNRKREQLIEDLRKNNFRTFYEITDGDDIEETTPTQLIISLLKGESSIV